MIRKQDCGGKQRETELTKTSKDEKEKWSKDTTTLSKCKRPRLSPLYLQGGTAQAIRTSSSPAHLPKSLPPLSDSIQRSIPLLLPRRSKETQSRYSRAQGGLRERCRQGKGEECPPSVHGRAKRAGSRM